MPEATIKIRAFPYYEKSVHPVTGEDRFRERIATRGQTVELSDADYERAERYGAIEGVEAPTAEVEAPPGTDTGVVETAEWIKTSKPTVDETVAEAEGDPEKAKQVLEAENVATGGQPRRGVVDGLTQLIESEKS
jgi:ABC-type transport system substrate-binding protein